LPDGATPRGAPESRAAGADHDSDRWIGIIGKIEEAFS
jgi:hypothetical protein